MKTTLLVYASLASHAQGAMANTKKLLTSKTWKTNYRLFNCFKPANLTQADNIKNLDVCLQGNSYTFRNDGIYIIRSTQNSCGNGVWEVQDKTSIRNSSSASGGARSEVVKDSAIYWQERHMRSLALCNVTSLYEVPWTPAQAQQSVGL